MNTGDLNKIWEIKSLKKKPAQDEAQKILEKIAKQVQPIMKKHKWRVKLLTEFCPQNPALLGLNVGGGVQVKLRLRRANRDCDFIPYDQVLDTMLHELCHNDHGPHNAAFYKLWDDIRKMSQKKLMAVFNGWRRIFFCLSIIFCLPYLFSVLDLHHKPNIDNLSKNHRKKFDHLVLGSAAGQGLHNRLQCQGLKAFNRTHVPSSSDIPNFSDSVSFVTVFTIYNTFLSAHANVDMVTVGNTSYSKIERSMAVLDVFINFIQVSMPSSNIFILTDPASELPIQRNGVTILPIKGEYSRDRLMLQRIRSYIAFLTSRLDEISQRQGQIHHYIFTDSDIAVVDDLRHIFNSFPKFHLAVTFRNNKDQPLNSGFIAVRGTLEGVRRAKLFLQEVLEIYSSKYMKASRMLGDQLALAWVVKSHISSDSKRFTRSEAFMDDIGGTSVLFLPCAIYNWTPPEGAGQFHGMPLDVKVVHFKGSRKRLMLESWNFYNSEASISDMLCLILSSGRTKYDF